MSTVKMKTASTSKRKLPWRVEKVDPDNQVPMAEMSIEDFLVWREQQKQRLQIETRQAMAHTPSLYFWTRRVTSTDIISMITTTKATGPGQLKQDIGAEWADAVKNSDKDNAKRRNNKTPLLDPVHGNNNNNKSVESNSHHHRSQHQHQHPIAPSLGPEERQKINHSLWDEQKQFMEKLNRKRSQRLYVETSGARRIQACFRGFLVRKQKSSLYQALLLRKSLGEDLHDFLDGKGMILRGAEYKQKIVELRHHKVIIIQCAYRRVLSYRAYERKRMIRATDIRHQAASTIQRLIRTWRSRQLTNKLREPRNWLRRQKACIRIQALARAFQGRRRYQRAKEARREKSAIIIQCLLRRRRAYQRVKVLQKTKADKSREYGARCIQRIVRGFLGRKRLARLRRKAKEKKRSCAVLRIQTGIRKCLGCRRVDVRRIRGRQCRRLWAVLHIQRVCRGFVGRKRASNRKLLLSVDIWVQVRLGDEVLVEDIYTGSLTGEPLAPDLQDEHGNTLLMLAARYGHLKIVRKCLLQWDMKLSTMNQRSQTALRVALAHRHAAVAEYLLTKQEALVVAKSGTRTLLHEAARGGLHQCALVLVNHGVDVDSIDPATGRSALHEACKHGHAEILRLLLKDTQALNAQDKEGRTCLHWAGIRGSEECVCLLLEAGVGVTVLDSKGRPAVLYAMLRGLDSVVDKLKEAWILPKEVAEGVIWTPEELEKALTLVESNQTILLEELLKLGMPIDMADSRTGDFLLTRAARVGCTSTLEMLVKAGAKLTTANGVTALHTLLNHHPSLALDASFDLSILAEASTLSLSDSHGRTPFHLAAQNGCDVSRFPKSPAINRPDASGFTALHLAATSLMPQAIRSLIALGADPAKLDKSDRSPLHTFAVTAFSTRKNSKPSASDVREALRILLSTHASLVTAKDKNGCTPLVLAATSCNTPVLEGLLSKATPQDKTDAAFAAVRAGQVESLEMISASSGVDLNTHREEANGGLNLTGCAIKAGQNSVLEWLLAQDSIDPLACCEKASTRTALHMIATHGTVGDLATYLQSAKWSSAKILEDKDSQRWTALTVAILAHNDDVADALIKQGASARNALHAGTWGWVLATVNRQEKGKK